VILPDLRAERQKILFQSAIQHTAPDSNRLQQTTTPKRWILRNSVPVCVCVYLPVPVCDSEFASWCAGVALGELKKYVTTERCEKNLKSYGLLPIEL